MIIDIEPLPHILNFLKSAILVLKLQYRLPHRAQIEKSIKMHMAFKNLVTIQLYCEIGKLF